MRGTRDYLAARALKSALMREEYAAHQARRQVPQEPATASGLSDSPRPLSALYGLLRGFLVALREADLT